MNSPLALLCLLLRPLLLRGDNPIPHCCLSLSPTHPHHRYNMSHTQSLFSMRTHYSHHRQGPLRPRSLVPPSCTPFGLMHPISDPYFELYAVQQHQLKCFSCVSLFPTGWPCPREEEAETTTECSPCVHNHSPKGSGLSVRRHLPSNGPNLHDSGRWHYGEIAQR